MLFCRSWLSHGTLAGHCGWEGEALQHSTANDSVLSIAQNPQTPIMPYGDVAVWLPSGPLTLSDYVPGGGCTQLAQFDLVPNQLLFTLLGSRPPRS